MTFGLVSNQQRVPWKKYLLSLNTHLPRSFYHAERLVGCHQKAGWQGKDIMMLNWILEKKEHIISGWCLSGFLCKKITTGQIKMFHKKKSLLKWRAMSSHTVELGCFFVYSKRKKKLDRWHDYLAWQKRAVCHVHQTSGLFSVISGSTFHVYGPLKDNLFNSPCRESTQHPVHLWMKQTKRDCERGGRGQVNRNAWPV